MRKIRLDVDTLQVESFETDRSAVHRGTVHGNFDPEYADPNSPVCDGWGTWGTCIGPTYCCLPTWRPTCRFTCETYYPPEKCGGS